MRREPETSPNTAPGSRLDAKRWRVPAPKLPLSDAVVRSGRKSRVSPALAANIAKPPGLVRKPYRDAAIS